MFIQKQIIPVVLFFAIFCSRQNPEQAAPAYRRASDSIPADTLTTTLVTKDSVVNDSAQRPAFSYNNLRDYIFSHLNYPPQAIQQEIEGKVYVRFTLEKDGSIGDIRLVKSVHPLLDSTALGLIRRMPHWQPLIHKGIPQQLPYTVPVIFELKE